ncbi:hypothetical protein HaLaN_25468 [Haematococcus lacustris]|uniref:Uncharacterized protein n=1 Tax=Haematococcus lacustris TaxID=44745 RepID=A0A6A0A4G3_HAELA|nr:hypothetical protein HaLaN_25468 [Haematococcus lacustris]
MMSGAAAWTTGQEGGGRDRNHSPGRQAGPQQLVAARSYPKFVYSYTSLAKPLVMEVIQVTPVQEDGVEHQSSELGGVVEGIQEDIHRALTQQVQVKMKFKLANSKPLPKLHPPGLSAITSLPPALPPAQG